jgi:hypothetical protein
MEYIPVSEKAAHHIQFWKTWVKSEACFLSKMEITTIEDYAFKTLFVSGDLLSSFKMENQIKLLERLNEKQRADYSKHKERVTNDFLSSILKMAEPGNKEMFMQVPICKLEILNYIKGSLSKSGIHTLHDFFEVLANDEIKNKI